MPTDENNSTAEIISEIVWLRQRFEELSRQTMEHTALQLSEEKYAKAFFNNPDPISISTLTEGRFIDVNPAYCETAGYKRSDIIGHTVHQLGIWTVPGDRDIMTQQLLQNGSISGLEAKFHTKPGEIRTFLLSMEIIELLGEPCLLNSSKDITELKEIEEALRLSEERFSMAFNASPIAICINSLEDGRFLDINDSFCRILGTKREKIIGYNDSQIGIWVDTEDRRIVRQSVFEKGSVNDMEVKFAKESGEILFGLYSAERLDINGEICLLSLFKDLTERKQLETEIGRLDRLNLIGEMAASIAHEIRNPMTTVRGYLQFLKDNNNYNKEIEYFDLMIEELDSANGIITEFISLAKNKMVELKQISLNSILKNIYPLLQATAMIQDKSILLDIEDVPELLMDEKEICQLVFNLVKNGLEASPASAIVSVRTFLGKDAVVLAVEDEGYGIAPDILPQLGTPFFSTKEQPGLGLAVCYGIATRHNARIEIITSSSGTSFFIHFGIQFDEQMR